MALRSSLLVLASSIAVMAACGDSGAGGAGGDGAGTSNGGDGEGAGNSTGGSDPTGGAPTGGAGTGGAGDCGGGCEPGEVCAGGQCVPGCDAQSPCPGGIACCGGACIDTDSDPANCGGCDAPCPDLANIEETCSGGFCGAGNCDSGFNNCDGDVSNGCETAGACACTPGSTQPCYTGPSGTEGVGVCTGGTQMCLPSGLAYGLCTGQVLPSTEVCADNLDNDCNNQVDEDVDADGDGYGTCSGDCCDAVGPGCGDPDLVNPGAFEYPGNMVDDDCNPATTDAGQPTTCSTVQKLTGVTPVDMLNAMDICETSVGGSWGIVSAQFLLANGNTPSATQLSNMQNSQAAILTAYGTDPSNTPQLNATMAGISSGAMRYQGQTGYVNPNPGTAFNVDSTPPAAYLAANGGALPSSAGCSGNCPAGTGANDPVNLRAQIKVPTNAQSMSYKFRFFSSEYWTYSCTTFNDFYLALLTSTAMGIPADKNISFDAAGNPVSVNNGFFEVCQPKGCYTCPSGLGGLAGTGMQLNSGSTGPTGGATNWLTTTAPVVGGETITMEFMVFDVSDNILDTNVLLDSFQFSVTPSGVGTTD